MTEHTLFHSASTTKAFTAALAALVVQDEENFKDITWTTKLHDVIPPDFVLTDKYASDETTLQDALSHRSGAPRHDLAWIATNASNAEVTRAMRFLPLSKPFRTTYQYCNNMFTAVAHLLDTITEGPLGELYSNWLFKPMGMNETYTDTAEALKCQSCMQTLAPIHVVE